MTANQASKLFSFKILTAAFGLILLLLIYFLYTDSSFALKSFWYLIISISLFLSQFQLGKLDNEHHSLITDLFIT
ncbi:MAG: hypothetical protein KDD94_10750, partial [Calditrichaeota bacterium]|nr:hypothetical protein [Calditrichota bacterium]